MSLESQWDVPPSCLGAASRAPRPDASPSPLGTPPHGTGQPGIQAFASHLRVSDSSSSWQDHLGERDPQTRPGQGSFSTPGLHCSWPRTGHLTAAGPQNLEHGFPDVSSLRAVSSGATVGSFPAVSEDSCPLPEVHSICNKALFLPGNASSASPAATRNGLGLRMEAVSAEGLAGATLC